MLSVIIPAHNEADYIGACLASLMQQDGDCGDVEIIVVANASTDDTVPVAEQYRETAKARGWSLTVLDIPEGGKPNALNQGDAAASGDMRLYLDADITMDRQMLVQLVRVLDQPGPAYASGQMIVTEAKSWVTRRFMDLWQRVPFMTASGATGAGLFAVNAAGRARWGDFPAIISDDGYVRLQFTPEERHEVTARYFWPPVEGFSALVRVRRRQDAGNHEIAEKYPELLANESKPGMRPADHMRLFLQAPVSYLIYAAVKIAVRFGSNKGWVRGR